MPKYIYPTTMHGVSDDFQDHVNRGSVNPGTDYKTVDSSGWHKPVYAVAAGIIEVCSYGIAGSGGRYLQYNVGGGVIFQDLHLSQILVSEGQHVTQGQQIAVSGASAYGSETGTGGPHLHHAMKVNGRNVDFENFLDIAKDITDLAGAIVTRLTTPKKKDNTMIIRNVHSSGNSQNFLFQDGGIRPIGLLNDVETAEMCKITGQDIAHLNDDTFTVSRTDSGFEPAQVEIVSGVLARGVRY